MRYQFNLLFLCIISCFGSALWSCYPPHDKKNINPLNDDPCHYQHETISSMLPIVTYSPTQVITMQSLVTICCTQFVRNNLKTLQQNLKHAGLPSDLNLLKTMVKAALALPSQDDERLNKTIEILKKMPLELYGDFAFFISQYSASHWSSSNEKYNEALLASFQCLPTDIIRIKTIGFFKNHIRTCPLDIMIENAVIDSEPYQIMEILLTNGAIPNSDTMLNLIPYEITDDKFSKNSLQKLKLVLTFKTSQRKHLKAKASDLLSAWSDKEWPEGTKTMPVYPEWHKLDKEATSEEVEKNKQFFNNAIKLIEYYEELEAQEKCILITNN